MGNATSVLGVEADIRLGSSPARFWEACRSGDASALDEELKRHPSLLNRRTNGQTAVMRLAELGDVEALAVLARHVRPAATLADPCGAPPRALTLADLVNQTNGKNQTALMTACWEGNHDVVKLLVAWGADVLASDRCGGKTALHYAAFRGHDASVRHILAPIDALPPAEAEERRKAVLDRTSGCGFTALHYAVASGHLSTVRLLLSCGANQYKLSTYDSHGMDWFNCRAGTSAMHLAALSGCVCIIRELLKHYAERAQSRPQPDPRRLLDHSRCSPHARATQAGRAQAAQLLSPALPLSSIFRPEELDMVGVPKLAALAGAALRSKLLRDLARATAASTSLAPLPPSATAGPLPAATAAGTPASSDASLRTRQARWASHQAELVLQQAPPAAVVGEQLDTMQLSCKDISPAADGLLSAHREEKGAKGEQPVAGDHEDDAVAALQVKDSASALLAAAASLGRTPPQPIPRGTGKQQLSAAEYAALHALSASPSSCVVGAVSSSVRSAPTPARAGGDVACCSSSSVTSSQAVSPAPASDALPAPSFASAVAGPAEEPCCVCLEAACDVRLGGCGHAMCSGCCRQLCTSAKPTAAPKCPYCRANIAALMPLVC